MKRFWIATPGHKSNRSFALQEAEIILSAEGVEFEWQNQAPVWFDPWKPWITFIDHEFKEGSITIPRVFSTSQTIRSGLLFGALILLQEDV